MRRRIKQFAAVAVVCMVVGGAAFANATIADDQTEEFALISGSVNFSTAHWTAHVDYAVYAPEQYPGDHPDANDETKYIYAYQLFKDTDNSIDEDELSSLNISLVSGADVPDYSLSWDDTYGIPNGVIPPQITFFPLEYYYHVPPIIEPTSVNYGWAAWPTGVHSPVLLFSSPYTYMFDSATVARDNGGSDTHDLPSPIPEPATMSLLVLGGLALVRRRRK